MNDQRDQETPDRKQRDQMLKLVTKGFYRELTNYGVRREEIVRVASHLLDNLLTGTGAHGRGVEYYDRIFTMGDVDDEWSSHRRLSVREVTIRPLSGDLVPVVAEWLQVPSVRDSFVPRFPSTESALREHLDCPSRDYFAVYLQDDPVGIVGAENVDPAAGKLEMKKLIGKAGLRGKGIGKLATFAFLYYAFMVRNARKVYIHSCDINIRNINLNSRFGFELEGVFFDEVAVAGRMQDIVRMALFKAVWLQIFARPADVPVAAVSSNERWWEVTSAALDPAPSG